MLKSDKIAEQKKKFEDIRNKAKQFSQSEIQNAEKKLVFWETYKTGQPANVKSMSMLAQNIIGEEIKRIQSDAEIFDVIIFQISTQMDMFGFIINELNSLKQTTQKAGTDSHVLNELKKFKESSEPILHSLNDYLNKRAENAEKKEKELEKLYA